MTATYDCIATTTLSTATASITFSSISGSYTDLVLSGNGFASGDAGINVTFNGDEGSNYSYTYVYGDGTSAVSGRASNTQGSGGRLGTNGAVSIFQIMNYSNSTTYKTMISRGSNAGALTIAVVSLWRSTSAITSIKMIKGNGGNFDANTSFSLFGIKAE